MAIVFHAGFPGIKENGILYRVCRSAVPFFFLISGYFTYSRSSRTKRWISNKIITHTKTFIVAFLVYFLLNFTHTLANEYTAESIFTLRHVIDLFAFNYVTPFLGVGHLWFYMSLIYIYALLYLENKYDSKQMHVVVLLLLTGCFCIEFIVNSGSKNVFDPYYRNFLFTGFPMFMIGYYIHSKVSLYSSRRLKCATIGAGLIGTMVLIAEYFLNICNYELYLSSILLAITGLLFCILSPGISSKNKILRRFWYCVADVGKKYTKDIYIWHYLVILIAQYASNIIPLVTKTVNAITVFLVSLMILVLRKALIHSFN